MANNTSNYATPVKGSNKTARNAVEDWGDLCDIAIAFPGEGRMKEVTLKSGVEASLYENDGYNAKGLKHTMSVWDNEGNPNGTNMHKWIK
jgi:hypothetical protein